jgi:zinc transport system ATP-binding protein
MSEVNIQNAVEIQNVCLSYGKHTILDSVSFAIPEGRYVGIVGPNGGGKTTLLKILLGLVTPDRGDVQIFDQPPKDARRRGRIGYVPQRVAQAEIAFPISVEEMVWSGRTPAIGVGHWSKVKDRKAIDHALETAGVLHLRTRLIGSLSGGERQRVYIARALASEPKLLILDEPTTGIDISAKEQFYTLLKKLNTEHKLTILFVSHDIEVMTNEVTFVLALNQKILCHCHSHEFLSEKTVEKLYGRNIHLSHFHH